jgi:hypothetical protein
VVLILAGLAVAAGAVAGGLFLKGGGAEPIASDELPLDAGHRMAVEGIIDAVDEFANQACRCANFYCAENVRKEFMAFLEKSSDAKGSELARARIEVSAEKLMSCLQARVAADSATPPPAPIPVPEPEPSVELLKQSCHYIENWNDDVMAVECLVRNPGSTLAAATIEGRLERPHDPAAKETRDLAIKPGAVETVRFFFKEANAKERSRLRCGCQIQ